MSTIESQITQMYENKCETPSDINQHLPTLMAYAQQAETIVECGVRNIVSTWAFLKGLLSNNSSTKKLVCVDIQKDHSIDNVIQLVNQHVDMQFIEANSATVHIPHNYDILFIDTWHVYGHLKRELEHHHSKVNKWIIMHDTEVDKILGESIRCGSNIQQQMLQTGYSYEDVLNGLQKAITEFLQAHPEWQIEKVFTNNNGLTILKRVSKN